jgi:diguanylate cyclase (GGDEF)-like protein
MSFPHLPYIVTNAYCIVYAASVLLRLDRSIGSEHEVQELRNMIYAYFGMLVTDIFYCLSQDNILMPPRLINAAMSAGLVMSITLGCYFWYKFIEDRLHQTSPVKKRTSILTNIPVIVVCVLDVISIFTGWLFYIDSSNHYDSTALFDIQSVANYFYLVVPTVACAYRAIRTKQKSEREEYGTYAAYMVAPLLAGLLEGALPLVPVLELSIFMIIHILFLMIQNMQIYNDALTDLNNRRRLNQYLELSLPKASAERPVALLMLDLNGFKAINDTYGHIEGDNVLRSFAEILKVLAAQYSAFIARYGGDEFCLVTEGGASKAREIAAELQRQLEHTAALSDKYTLTVSVGYAVCAYPEFNPDAALSRADEMLYARKREWHSANR